MTIYDYLEQGEVQDNAIFAAAGQLIDAGFLVLPLAKGEKRPFSGIKRIDDIVKRPLHKKNYSHYFDRDDSELAIIFVPGYEVIDIDEKAQAGITKKVLSTIAAGWPELYEKLAIEETPSAGAHIHYLSEMTGGDEVLARVHGSPSPAAIIERLDESNKKYIKCAPSAGYYFKQRSPLNMVKLTVDERQWLVSVCRSFNQVVIPKAPKKEVNREDSPWNVFNKMHDWRYTLEVIKESGWGEVMSLSDKVVIKRPGATSKHSGCIFKESNILYLFSTGSDIEAGRPYSPFDIYCHFQHEGNFVNACKKLAEDGIGTHQNNEGLFWKKEGKRLKVKYTELANWLKGIGYYFIDKQLVQVIQNRVRLAEISDMAKAFISEIEDDVKDDITEKIGTIFSESGGLITAHMEQLKGEFIQDTQSCTWFFFSNYAVKVTGQDFESVLYKDVPGYVWDRNIIDRKFSVTDFKGCDAERFCRILGGENYTMLFQVIGYNLSRYKDPLIAKATVIMEDVDSENEGESQGRSGKGLLVKMLEHFRRKAYVNGKTINFADTFLWQAVDLDTNFIYIDDVEKSFRFEKLFSQITEDLEVNAKNKPKKIIPYNASPKIIITSNFAVGSMDDSTYDRKFEFPVVKYFSSKYKPKDEFKRAFFSEWPVDEWRRFDNFMVDCARQYLALEDKQKITVQTLNTIERSLQSNTDKAFVEWMDDQLQNNFFAFAPEVVKNDRVTINGKLVTNAVNVAQVMAALDNPDYYLVLSKGDLLTIVQGLCNRKGLTQTILTQWMKKWCEVRKVTANLSYKRSQDSGRHYRIISWGGEVQTYAAPQTGSQDLPF